LRSRVLLPGDFHWAWPLSRAHRRAIRLACQLRSSIRLRASGLLRRHLLLVARARDGRRGRQREQNAMDPVPARQTGDGQRARRSVPVARALREARVLSFWKCLRLIHFRSPRPAEPPAVPNVGAVLEALLAAATEVRKNSKMSVSHLTRRSLSLV
jgi:hypothetical protein